MAIDKKWQLILMLSLVGMLLPMAILLKIIREKEANLVNPPGAIVISPGKLIVTQEELLLKNPRNRALITAESLNRNLCILALTEPEKIPQLKSSNSKAVIDSLSYAFGEAPEKMEENIQRYEILWQPNLGPWGTFTPPQSLPPKPYTNPNIPTFGYVKLADGAAKTRYLTEKILNDAYLLHKRDGGSKNPPLQQLATVSASKGISTPESLPSLLAACEIFQITYNNQLDLFLSPQTTEKAKEWKQWTE